MATDYWNQSIFTRKKHHGQIMIVQISPYQGNWHRENGTHHDDHLLWTCAGRLF